MKIAYNPKSADNVITEDTAKSDDIIFDLKAKNIWAKGMRMGDADTVDGLHANSFVRKWYGVYGSANKFLSFDTSKEKGWIKLEVAESSNDVSGAYGIYIISWPCVGENKANPTVKCIYSTTQNYITALTAVRTDTTKFDLYFKFLGAAAYPTYTIYASASTSDLNYTVTAVTDIPTDNTYTSSLASLQLTASSADKWTKTHKFTIGNKTQEVDGSGDVSWSLAEIGVQNTWRTVKVNSNSINSNPLDLCSGTYVTVTKGDNGKVTFDVNSKISGMYKWYSATTDSSTDKAIDKWFEIVKFLEGIKTDDTLNTLLTNKLSITQISQDSNVNALKNNALYWVDTKSNTGTLTNRPFSSDSYPFALLSVTNYNESTFSYRSRIAFNDQGQMAVAKCHSESQQDWTDTWYTVLTSKNSGISDDSKITINNKEITVSKSDHNHDSIYVRAGVYNGNADLNTLSAYSFIESVNVTSNAPGSNGWYNVIQLVHRNGVSDGSSYVGQIALGMTTNTHDMFFRGKRTDSWKKVLTNVNSYVSKGIGYINEEEITQVTNSTNATLATSANKLNKWFSSRVADLNQQFGDGALRIFNATSSTTANKCPADASILHLAWDNTGGWDAQLALSPISQNIYFRGQNSGTWSAWRTVLHDGNSFISNHKITINGVSTTWENTWRTVQVNGTSIGTATLNLKAGNGISLSNSSGVVTIANNGVCVQQHTTNDINYPLVWSNQRNTNSTWGQQLFKSWSDLYYNPKNKRLTVGGSIIAGGAITAPGFRHSSVTSNTSQYVLTADGGYTLLNQIANEGVYTFDKNITVTNTWTDIDGFYGGNDAFLVSTGTYIVQVYYKTSSANNMWDGYFSGIMSWYTGKTNSNNADEIVLHRAGHAYGNTIYLRTSESPNTDSKPYTKLQISANTSLSQNTYTFKFKRIC